MKLRTKIVLLTILPVFIVGGIVVIFSSEVIKNITTEQLYNTLEATAVAGSQAYSAGIEGEYHLDDKGELLKGDDYNISEDPSIVDSIYEDTGLVSTFIYGNERMMTSIRDEKGDRIIGTTISDKVVDIINSGEAYRSKIDINGEPYNTYYYPVYQDGSDSEVIGCFFVGQETSSLTGTITRFIITLIVVFLVIVAICSVVAYIIADKITKAIIRGTKAMDAVARGRLSSIDDIEFNINHKDELGTMTNKIYELKEELKRIISDVVEDSSLLATSSETLSETAISATETINQVDRAIQDIADGAASQAEETQSASESINIMSNKITDMTNEIEILNDNANSMKNSGDEAMDTIESLEKTNISTMQAIDVIYDQTNTTNDSAVKIKEVIELITAIAEETNLLSLNASIEAARAGEQGRGFAVVATQIQKLAEQSNESTTKIEAIIDELIKDSAKAVNTMNDVKVIIDKQTLNVKKTENIFEKVKDGIDSSIDGIKIISKHSEDIEESKNQVVSIMSDLTAIAEENAASAEETSAATTEVSAAMSEVKETANHLKNIADSLENSISVFEV